jgi:hypothetical protein
MREVPAKRTTLFGIFQTVVAVLLINGVFYAYYRIATFQLHLSEIPFGVGCVVLFLIVVAVFRKFGKQDRGRSVGPLDE